MYLEHTATPRQRPSALCVSHRNEHDSTSPPVVPVGLDAYRQWERWPYQRIGVRAHLRSTYDRTGHNHTADASHYLHQQAEDFNVTLDVEGRGVLYFARANHWHGSPWHYEIDDVDHVVRETTTANPLEKLEHSVFLPEALFPRPLTFTYSVTKGADLNWVPMAFTKRLRLAHSRTFYGTGYYIFHQLAPGTALSRPLEPWDGRTPPDAEVLQLLESAGSDIAPAGGAGAEDHAGTLVLTKGDRVEVLGLHGGPRMLRKLVFSAPAVHAVALGRATLTVTWDDRAEPSIDAPLDLFFGAGTLHTSEPREWLVKALPMTIRFVGGRVVLECYFPMPFFRSARIELTGAHDGAPIDDVAWSVRTLPFDDPWNHVGYFHATYRDHGEPRFGEDLVFLETRGAEGSERWSGSFVGTSFVFTEHNVLTTLEGDPRFFFDDSRTPQAQGTGTEEWGGGGDYWGGRTMTLPLAGHPVGVVDARAAKHPLDLVHSAYRFLLADLMPFGLRAQIRFEHGGENESVEHYRTVAYWYGLPSPSLVLTDELDVGDAASEHAHDYVSADASAPYEVTSRYEWGPDHLPVSIARPLVDPAHCVEYEFEAERGRFDLWIEVRSGARLLDAALWPQFNDDIGTDRLDAEYMGLAGFGNAGHPPHTFRFNTSSSRVASVWFATSGMQRLRIQPRIGRVELRRVLLCRDCKRRPTADFAPAENDIVLAPAQAVRQRGAFAITNASIVLTEDPEAVEIFPATTLTGRRTHGASELTLELQRDNHGVMLRRTLDYRYANQRARVYVETGGAWEPAGIWYTAGSNPVYHSFPFHVGELAPARPVVITSNRRFRDDEFLLPVHLTRGRDRIRIRIECAPRNPPLLPGCEPQPTAWTELAYKAYCWVMPRVALPDQRPVSPRG